MQETRNTHTVGLIIFAGPPGESPVERMVEGARNAALVDMVDMAQQCRLFGPIIVVTDVPEVRSALGPSVQLEPGGDDFHFGRRLRDVVRDYSLKRIAVATAGSAPLLDQEGLGGLARAVLDAPGTVVANNLFSSDVLAFSPASVLEEVALPERDNHLAQVLRLEGGLKGVELPRTAATQFDIDTPTDLAILSVHERTLPHLRAYLHSLSIDASTAQRVGRLLTDVKAQVVIAGRVGSHVWAHLERETACRVRLFAEERGMEADGRVERGEVRSLLGYYAQELGLPKLFATLAELGDAAILDTRVLLAHTGGETSREDRFLSDLGRVEEVQDPFLRDLTLAAREAAIPVLLGGHSLVSGGLMALVEASWLAVDRERAPG